jgi:hypothetical protein
MRQCGAAQLDLGFGQGDIQHRRAAAHPFSQKLQRQGGLACAWHAFDQVQALGQQAARQYGVEAGDTRRQQWRRVQAACVLVLRHSLRLCRRHHAPALPHCSQYISASVAACLFDTIGK